MPLYLCRIEIFLKTVLYVSFFHASLFAAAALDVTRCDPSLEEQVIEMTCARKAQSSEHQVNDQGASCRLNHIPLVREKVTKTDILRCFEAHLRPFASRLLDRIYESESRNTQGKNSSLVFRIEPEFFLAYLQAVRGKRVLALAEASGEQAILLALAGASHVVIVDRAEKEIETCKTLIADLLPEYAQRITPIAQDCFQYLESLDYRNQGFDLVTIRHLIHFFSNSRIRKLLSSVYGVMNHGGLLYITTNAAPRPYGPTAERSYAFFLRSDTNNKSRLMHESRLVPVLPSGSCPDPEKSHKQRIKLCSKQPNGNLEIEQKALSILSTAEKHDFETNIVRIPLSHEEL